MKFIFANNGKNDRVDARSLARLARVDRQLLFPIHHRRNEAQSALSVLRARDAHVRARTRLINCVRGLVKPTGVHLLAASADCFPLRAATRIPTDLRLSTALTVEQIQALSDSIAVYDQYVEHLVETRYSKAKLLQQIPGVGALTSLAFILTLDDPARFPKSRQVGCYLGLRRAKINPATAIPNSGSPKAVTNSFDAFWLTPRITFWVTSVRIRTYADGGWPSRPAAAGGRRSAPLLRLPGSWRSCCITTG